MSASFPQPSTSSVTSDEKVDYVQVDKEKTQALQSTMQEWTDVRQSTEPAKGVKSWRWPVKNKIWPKTKQQQIKSDIPIIPITHHLQCNISVLTTNTGLAFNGQWARLLLWLFSVTSFTGVHCEMQNIRPHMWSARPELFTQTAPSVRQLMKNMKISSILVSWSFRKGSRYVRVVPLGQTSSFLSLYFHFLLQQFIQLLPFKRVAEPNWSITL